MFCPVCASIFNRSGILGLVTNRGGFCLTHVRFFLRVGVGLLPGAPGEHRLAPRRVVLLPRLVDGWFRAGQAGAGSACRAGASG